MINEKKIDVDIEKLKLEEDDVIIIKTKDSKDITHGILQTIVEKISKKKLGNLILHLPFEDSFDTFPIKEFIEMIKEKFVKEGYNPDYLSNLYSGKFLVRLYSVLEGIIKELQDINDNYKKIESLGKIVRMRNKLKKILNI